MGNNSKFARKICHLTSVHGPLDVRIFNKECRSLAAAGYEVVIVAPYEKNDLVDKIKIISVPKPKMRLYRMMVTTWQVFHAALKVNASIYHIHDPELLLWGQILRLFGKTIVYDMHENVPKALLTKSWIWLKLRWSIAHGYRLIERILLGRIAVIFAEESYVRDYRWIKESIVVLNMPLVHELSDISEPKHLTPTLGYIGSVTPERGSFLTLNILGNFKNSGFKLHWECIGPVTEKHKSQLKASTEALALEGVYIRGYLPPREGWRMISRCHVGLAIIAPIPNYIESYPTKMFEYMALGLPVVVSDFPLYRDIVETCQCGICVNYKNVDDIVAAIRKLLVNSVEAEAMGKRGQDAVRRMYNWEREEGKLLAFYKKILN